MKIKYQDRNNLTPPWTRLTMIEAVLKYVVLILIKSKQTKSEEIAEARVWNEGKPSGRDFKYDV